MITPHSGQTPMYPNNINPVKQATTKLDWEYHLMRHQNCVNMNSALKVLFLSLIDSTMVDAYKNSQDEKSDGFDDFFYCVHIVSL